MSDKSSNDALFRFHWLDGSKNEGRGRNAADALRKLGFGHGATRALDYWEQVRQDESVFSAATLEMLEDAEREDHFGE